MTNEPDVVPAVTDEELAPALEAILMITDAPVSLVNDRIEALDAVDAQALEAEFLLEP